MKVLKDIYESLVTGIESIGTIKTIALENSQLEKLEEENPIDFPCALIHFNSMNAQGQGYRVQPLIEIKVAIESFKNEDLTIFDRLQEVANVVTPAYPLMDVVQDIDHDMVIAFTLIFQCPEIDWFGYAENPENPDNKPQVTLTIQDVELDASLDIDNDIYRVGNGV
jgi:hypothetical protein